MRKKNKAAEKNVLKVMKTDFNENSIYMRSLCVQTKIMKKISSVVPYCVQH